MKLRSLTVAACLALAVSCLFMATSSSAAPKAKPAAPSVAVTTVTPAQLKTAIAASRGKVVVVNFWATWCGPCVEELPSLAQLRDGSKGKVKLILVSGDEASDMSRVKSVLARTQHRASLLIKGDQIEFFEKYDPNFKGDIALPLTFIYDKKGTKVRSVKSAHSLAEYRKMVAPYL